MMMNYTEDLVTNMTVVKDDVNTTLVTVWPPLDMRGVAQPIPTTKDIIVIMFMIMLWIYSIYLTARAYKKLLSDGRAETEIQLVDWWRFVLRFFKVIIFKAYLILEPFWKLLLHGRKVPKS